MLKRLFISIFIVLVIGLAGIYFLREYVRGLRVQEDIAARQEKRKDISVTIVEGKRREEIALLLAADGICSASDFLKASTGDEGRLFPDTYRFFPNTPAADVVTTLTQNFTAKAGNPTEDQIILASIVEREALNDSQRADIAGVYANRLRLGMNLEADPTVQYAKDNEILSGNSVSLDFKFWGPITQDDYKGVISPYNTYLNPGLPPTPIANPGVQSILAAEHPTQHDYLYFINKDGKLLLAKTLAEHLSQE